MQRNSTQTAKLNGPAATEVRSALRRDGLDSVGFDGLGSADMRRVGLAAVISALVSVVGIGGALAGEGMWVPQQLPEIAGPLKKAGLKLNPKQLADLTGDPMAAVVSLGGCTASFVSP